MVGIAKMRAQHVTVRAHAKIWYFGILLRIVVLKFRIMIVGTRANVKSYRNQEKTRKLLNGSMRKQSGHPCKRDRNMY